MFITPLANGIEFLIFLFIIGSSIVSKLMQAKQEAKARPGQRPGPKPAARPPQAKTDVEREIEVFLRRTAEGKGHPKAGRAGGQANQPPPTPPQRRPRQRPTTGTARRGSGAPSSTRQRPEQTFPTHESVGEHVERHIEQGIVKHDPPLAEGVGMADERMETHLHDSFDHALGSIAKSDLESDEIREGTDADVWALREEPGPNRTAQRVREMLMNPQDVGAAFIMTEILRRPEDRFDED